MDKHFKSPKNYPNITGALYCSYHFTCLCLLLKKIAILAIVHNIKTIASLAIAPAEAFLGTIFAYGAYSLWADHTQSLIC